MEKGNFLVCKICIGYNYENMRKFNQALFGLSWIVKLKYCNESKNDVDPVYFFRSFMCSFRCNIISARNQWRRLCSLRLMTVVCTVCRCWFYTNHPFSEENFCHIISVPWLCSEQVIFWASGMIFSLLFLYFCCTRF